MIINSRSSNFIFNYPRGFFLERIENKYINYIKRMSQPYDTVHTFMNSLVQSVTFPALSMDTVQQTRLYGKTQEYKGSRSHIDLFAREMTVEMKSVDGYLNYWIFLENAIEYLKQGESNPKLYFDDMHIRFLSQEGFVINTVRFHGVILTGISEIIASYSDNNPEYRNLSCTFHYNILEIGTEKD